MLRVDQTVLTFIESQGLQEPVRHPTRVLVHSLRSTLIFFFHLYLGFSLHFFIVSFLHVDRISQYV